MKSEYVNMERGGRNLFRVIIATFAWRDWKKLR